MDRIIFGLSKKQQQQQEIIKQTSKELTFQRTEPDSDRTEPIKISKLL